MSRRAATELGLAALAFAAGTWLYLGPSIGSPVGRLGPDLGDPRLNLYFVSWVAHALGAGDLAGLWSPPFFHPTPGVLAYSDHLIGPGVCVWLAGALGIGPVTAFNLLFLASFVLTGVVAFWFFRRLRLGVWAALLGGWFVAFSHLRWDEVSHYQVLRAQWIPAVLWCFDRLLVAPRAASAAAFLAVYLLHVSGGTYLAYMIHVPLAVIAFVRLRELGWRGFVARPRRTWLIGTAAASLALLAPFVWGYVAEWGSRTIPRQLLEVRSVGALLASFATPSHDALIRDLGIFGDHSGRGALFPGVVLLLGCLALLLRRAGASRGELSWQRAAVAVAGLGVVVWALLLADAYTLEQSEAGWLTALGQHRYNGPRLLALLGLAAAWLALRGRRREPATRRPARDPFVVAFVAGGAACLWLALPVGFTSVYRQLPGMSGMRVSHRFFVFALLALAYLGARGLEFAAGRITSRSLRAALVLALSVAAIAEATPRRWRWAPVPERAEQFAPYTRFLAEHGDIGAYVEAPLFGDHRETERMHAQTTHWKPMLNGYSARFAPSYRRALEAFRPLPDGAGLARLRALGVSHLVVHLRQSDLRGRRPNRPLATAVKAAARRGDLELVFAEEGGDTAVYRIVASATETPQRKR